MATGEPDADGLDETERRLVLLAACVATGGVAPELRDHLRALHAADAGRELPPARP